MLRSEALLRRAVPGTGSGVTDQTLFPNLLHDVEQIVKTCEENSALLAVCELLRDSVTHYDWVGFYLADPATRTLTLGPFAGAPTEHVEIGFGRGICGQAAERRETFLVQDVSKEANYLSCSVDVQSEIVVPILRGGRVVAEIDIDSHALAPFTDEDRAFLERVAAIVAPLI